MKTIGRYEIVTELGRGAMGEVYQARDPLIGRLVALKVITSGLAGRPELLDRFYQEARSAGTLQHPNIVTIYDLGKEGDLPFIAMEYLSGESVEKLIGRRQAMPLSRKVGYIVQTCRALAYAHKHGVVHRDIKPGNIMVTAEDAVKVVDFGIARLVDASKTQTGALIGTLGYMSPQQLRGERADERSDIWAVGVMFYELLAYQRPFSGDNPAALVLNIISKEPAPLDGAVPGCPTDVEAIIFRMLQKEAVHRYQSMDEVLLDLDPVWKRLQQEVVGELVTQSEQLIEAQDLKHAQILLHEALQVDSGCREAKALLDTVNREVRRQDVLPRVQEQVARAQELLAAGQWQQAKVGAQSALQLDSTCEAARELLAAAEQGIARADEIERKLRSSKQQMAAGELTDADREFQEILTLDPQNQQAQELQRQVREERNRRERQQDLDRNIREIQVRIQRDELTDAIDLAKETVATLGPDTSLTQLLELAEEERNRRETKKAQDQKFSEARTLLDAGKQIEASQIVDQTIATQLLSASDPRVETFYADVEKEKNRKTQVVPAPAPAPKPRLQEQMQEQAAPATVPAARIKRFPLSAVGSAAAVLVIVGGLYFFFSHHNATPQTQTELSRPPLPAEFPPAKQPPLNPVGKQQRDLMAQAQKLVVGRQFDQAIQTVDRALKLNGPLQAELEHMRANIQKASSDKAAQAALQKENQIWNAAVTAFARDDFETAARDFRQVAGMHNGVHQADAQNYLNNLIPEARYGRQLQHLIGQFGADSANQAALLGLQGQFRKLESAGGEVGSEARDYAENQIPARLKALLQPASTATAAGPAAPTGGTGTNAIPAAEASAYKSFYDLPPNRPQDTISRGEGFLKNYPQSAHAGAVYSRLTMAYQATGQEQKMLEAGRNALKLNPNNVDVLSALAFTIPRRIDAKNPASAQLLQEAAQYAGRGIGLLEKMQKPANLSAAQFDAARNVELAACHSGLGLVAFYQNNNPAMISELKQAVSLNPRPDPSDQYLLGVAYAKAGRWSDAQRPLEECGASSGPMQQRCRAELAEVEKNAPPPSLFALHNDCLTVAAAPTNGNGAAAIASLHNHCSQALSVVAVVLNPSNKGGDGGWCKVGSKSPETVAPGGDLALGGSSLGYCEKSNCSDVQVKWNATFASDHQRMPAPEVRSSRKCGKSH